MDPISPLITQGGIGVLAALLLWLFLAERKDHREDNRANLLTINQLQEARRLDAVESRSEVTSVLPSISQSLNTITDKIEVVQQNTTKGRR